jgi:hypothetical protein
MFAKLCCSVDIEPCRCEHGSDASAFVAGLYFFGITRMY